MNKLENLREITDRQLGGLQATGKMLGEIKLKAATAQRPALRLRPVLALCTALLIVFGAVWALQNPASQQGPAPSLLSSLPAGEGTNDSTEAPADSAAAASDLSSSGVSIGSARDIPAYRSIFADAQGGNFPMILLDGAAYRMLKAPAQVSGSLLNGDLGQVTEYNLEPALSSGGVVSNIVSLGDSVYAIAGMKGAMVAASVNGEFRAFQRVSFAGAAIIGSESLSDTLCAASDVLSMELSGVGAIDDASEASRLMGILLSNAEYQNASVSSGESQALLLGLKNGLTLQLTVSGDSLSACGTWSCPEFFEAFAVAMAE